MSIAVIGYGKMGRLYDSLLGASAVVDPHPVDGKGQFRSVREFIDSTPAVDLVILCTPTDLHFEHAAALLEAGHHLLVEKPICLDSRDALGLELLAREKGLTLVQSCLERYNPAIKFIVKHVDPSEVTAVQSVRIGERPVRHALQDPKVDLAIHDLDLWFHVFGCRVPVGIRAGYGEPRREMTIQLRDGGVIRADLSRKTVEAGGRKYDLAKSSSSNPILEMVNDVLFLGPRANEEWHKEIRVLERQSGPEFELFPWTEEPARVGNGAQI